MKEILYQYNNSGIYLTEEDTSFAGETHLKLVIKPHDFSIAVGGEVLRSTSYDGGAVVVSCDGAVAFYDKENALIAQAEKGDACYKQVRFKWQPDTLCVQFGCVEQVDYYPNCDGEHDRWGEEWVAQRTVTLHLKDRSIVAE